ncbi:sensor histidine kinase [Clostridium algidicarnis]|uniref:histidine kinase n=1 Tax=Clostridium algidicarnis DSM 15099 TaxID=1121295 RepID=A0A2S6G0G7_9CLOT|nr:ATP-binding protein [Clostridium algidicarnis]MCB2286773.1 HAMP domain-containing histidine kinase [Clostridium algidicarnis]PPK49378.1 histidine kinase [Clostridium algidicarnis DSM 15099]
MKNKIAFKLIMYFSATLLLFSIIIGSVFMTLFKNHTMKIYKSDLGKRAVTIADTLSNLISDSGSSTNIMGGKHLGYGSYLRLLDDIAMTDVWIVDENLDLITSSHMESKKYNYADLPADAEAVVKEVFQGKTTFSEGFSNLLNAPTLTVGTPIEIKGKVIGALLLHSPVEGMNEGVLKGFSILTLSILVALILSIILSIILAVAFTKPLKKMKDSALQLAAGDYSSKTGVRQKDEIGELASAIDVLSDQLDLASQERQKLYRLRQDFISNISHELRTPVTVIRGSLEALCEEIVTDPDQIKIYHHQMLRESLYLQRLVNDLLDLSRLQNTDFKIEMQQINLCDVINDVIRSASQIAKLKGVNIKQNQDTHIFEVLGDYGRLRQMLLIILDNAIKFSPKGGVVTLTLKNRSVSIKDNGIGISKEDLPYIFDRFYKVKSEANKNGTGLGLAIAKQIADRHNINVTLNSKQNEETQFKFQF